MFGKKKTIPEVKPKVEDHLRFDCDFRLKLAKALTQDDRFSTGQSFLMQFSTKYDNRELLSALSTLKRIAEDSREIPSEFFAHGMMLNLRNAEIAARFGNRDGLYEERLERAMIIIETCSLASEMIEFFIVVCLEWVTMQKESTLLAAHYAERAARLRPSGTLTKHEWNALRSAFLRNLRDNNIFHALKAHLAPRGDTEVHFPRPK